MPEAAETPPETESGAQPGVFIDPFRAYNFKLTIQGVVLGHFTKLSELAAKINVLEFREGGQSQVVHQIPGQVEYSKVVLHYGVTAEVVLREWFQSAVKGKVERKNVSILMLDSEGIAEVMRWDLINAWPCEWRGAPLDALNGGMAIETLVLAYETLEWA